ncbi:MAG: VCBS repeat-containing protein [Euryarchaeota archaeon]|nr:VCBS repeat-containing protein [Euryarchaeota archaeon]
MRIVPLFIVFLLIATVWSGCTAPDDDDSGTGAPPPGAFDPRAPEGPLFGEEGGLGASATVAAVGYVDDDELYDLYLGGPDGGRLLLGKSAGRFQDATDAWSAGCPGCEITSVAIGDLDEDGWSDIVVLLEDSLRVFMHQGDRFVDETDERVSDPVGGDALTLVDVTNDGALEILVGAKDRPIQVYTNHLKVVNTTTGETVYDRASMTEPKEDLSSEGATLRWDAGTFLMSEGSPEGTETDTFLMMYVDTDRYLDLVVSTAEGLRLHLADGEGGFGAAVEGAGFDEDPGARSLMPMDVENTQVFYLLAAGEEGVRLYKNTGRDSFADRSTLLGVPAGMKARAALPLDLDNDGWLDILVLTDRGSRVLWSAGGEEFFEVRDPGLGTTAYPMMAAADFDRDGKLDVIAFPDGEDAVRYRNMVDAGPYFTLHLFGNQSNSAGLGVKTTLSSTSLIQSRQAGGDASASVAVPIDPHFGIGESRAPEYTLAIIWPSGILQFEAIDKDRVVDRRLPATESAKEAPWEEC